MLALIRGAGDIASGAAMRLWRCGIDVVMTDLARPTAIRRTVAFSDAIVHGETTVEGLRAVRAENAAEAKKLLRGTIDFVHGCVGAKGDEKEDVLLVGDNMVNQTIPLILCAEEDVEGNHGASIGKLDENMLFYAATRGIPPEEAQRLLTLAKIEAINSQIPSEEVRGAVDTYLKEQCI